MRNSVPGEPEPDLDAEPEAEADPEAKAEPGLTRARAGAAIRADDMWNYLTSGTATAVPGASTTSPIQCTSPVDVSAQ